MSAFESSYKSLLQGVSQQVAAERLPGQVGAQENMLSDAVTNIRRRPGAEYAFHRIGGSATPDNIKAWFTDIAGKRVHVLLNITTGIITLLDENHTELAVLNGAPYLTASSTQMIQATTVGDEFFFLNKNVTPTNGTPAVGLDPDIAGYFYIVAGAFNRKYEVTVYSSGGTGLISATYSTPSGAGGGDAAVTTPTYIAENLRAQLATLSTTLFDISSEGAYIFLKSKNAVTNNGVKVQSSTGSAYVMTSRSHYSTIVGNLPAQLPPPADGYIMAVGDTRLPQYYVYEHATLSWLECGIYGSAASLQNMPVSITYNGSTWGFSTTPYEGRLAGNTDNNPDPRFMTTGITGISTYQGRLVLLSGAFVNMSASNRPRRFFRSTVTSVLDSDPIEVGSSVNSSAAYEYAVAFQKDLVLFSASYQALVPSGNLAVTPRTASVVLTSTHDADTSCPPVTMGRTLMYPVPKSTDFFGVMEMVPSAYTDSQYISEDATPHLPKYMGGKCRFAVSSPVASMALFGSSGDKRALIVHEYLWAGDKKAQSSWHRWTFSHDIATVYFASDTIYILFAQNGVLVGATLDPRVGMLTFAASRRPYADLYSTVSIVNNIVVVPAWMLVFDPAAADHVVLGAVTGDLAGDMVGFTKDGINLRTVLSWSSGDVSIGYPYRSSITPTRPVIRDLNEVVIHTTKQTLLRYLVSTKNSAEYSVAVHDMASDGMDVDGNVGTLSWSSSELELGRSRYANEAVSVVPCRTEASTTLVEFYTAGSGELNITALEYVMKYNQKIRRR